MPDSIAEVVADLLHYLRRPEANFLWSSWQGPAEAEAELRSLTVATRGGDPAVLARLNLLFAPTGALQEVFNTSGWGEEFIEIATRFDKLKRYI